MNYRENNYVRKLEALIALGRVDTTPGAINSLTVIHSDDCGVFRNRPCDCEAEIVAADGRALEVDG